MMRRAISKLRKLIRSVFEKVRSVYVTVMRKALRIKECCDIHMGHYKTVAMSGSDWVLKNSDHAELLRFDIVVRYLAIEEYYPKNDYGFALYRKMQDARMGSGYSDIAVDQFLKLIVSYENNGYDKNSSIILDKTLSLIDGSHRIALALYYGIHNITVNIVHARHPVEYSIDWFISNGFSTKEVKLIVDKYKEILVAINQPFSYVIWVPAVSFSDQIITDLGYYGNVLSTKKYTYRNAEYNNIVRAIYAIDDIEKWKIEKNQLYEWLCA